MIPRSELRAHLQKRHSNPNMKIERGDERTSITPGSAHEHNHLNHGRLVSCIQVSSTYTVRARFSHLQGLFLPAPSTTQQKQQQREQPPPEPYSQVQDRAKREPAQLKERQANRRRQSSSERRCSSERSRFDTETPTCSDEANW